MVREMMTMLDSVPSVRAVPTSPEACPMCASSTLVMIALVFGDANSAMPEPITSWTSVTTHSDDAPSREEASKKADAAHRYADCGDDVRAVPVRHTPAER